MVCADLAARPAEPIWCSDASDDKIAGCVAPCSREEHRALWAHRDRRGCYAWLSRGASKWLAEHASARELQEHWGGASRSLLPRLSVCSSRPSTL
eukprot:5128698-Alexandrium_andersonii.AAC.1